MSWYNTKGRDDDVVVSTRIRFARNLSEFPFPSKLDEPGARALIERVSGVFGEGWTVFDMTNISRFEAASLAEKHFISPDFVSGSLPRRLIYSEVRGIYIMVCEEDHLRMQCILPGMALNEAYERLCGADDAANNALDIAYDAELGFLTSCPTNLGIAMRASVMLFLPALTRTRRLNSLFPQLSKIGLTIRGLYGEGSDFDGCLYQLSNQVTLGISEEDSIRKLNEVVRKIIESERAARNALYSDNPDAMTDRCRRAYGTLRYASLMSSGEFMKLYADIRLGISLGLIPELTLEALGGLMTDIQPATLSVNAGCEIGEHERDRRRAEYIRETLSATA